MEKRFIKLLLSNYLVSARPFPRKDFSKAVIVTVQHLLETTGSMFESLALVR